MQHQPLKACPKCGAANHLNAPACGSCGHQFRTQFAPADQTQMIYPNMPSQQQFPPYVEIKSKPNYAVIFGMWITGFLFNLMYFVTCGVQVNLVVAIFLDAPALIMALLLVNSKNGTDRANGWVKLVLEMIGFAIYLIAVISSHNPQ